MNRIILLADLHGNMTATKAMEEELKNIDYDELWFLGDAVGKGPQNDQTCDWVRRNCQYFIGGNWDYGMSDPKITKKEFYCKQLGQERIEWLQNLPMEQELLMSGILFRVFHGRPAVNIIQGYDSEESMLPYFKKGNKQYGGIICADSHRAFLRMTSAGYVINTGSIGNNLGVTNAHALLIEGEKNATKKSTLRFTSIVVPYDNKKEACIARQTPDLPMCDAYIKEITTGEYGRKK